MNLRFTPPKLNTKSTELKINENRGQNKEWYEKNSNKSKECFLKDC